MDNYLWFKVVDAQEPLEQGDILYDCPVLVPTVSLSKRSQEVEAEVRKYNVIVMSQSCDLTQGKLDLVQLCPFWGLSELGSYSDMFKGKGRERLRQGHYPGYHLLNRCDIPGFETDYLVVDFRSIYAMPFEFLKRLATEQEKRIRLLPPYREHLSQAFARFFMRVGLPIDIQPFQ